MNDLKPTSVLQKLYKNSTREGQVSLVSTHDVTNPPVHYCNWSLVYFVSKMLNHIYKLLKNHKFKFPIKITTFTENLVYDIDYSLPIDVNVSNITNYENYFDKDVVSKKDIYNIILEFQKYYNEKKIQMLYIHIDKEYEIDDIIKEFRKYYEEKSG